MHNEYALNQNLFFFKKYQKDAFLDTLDVIVEPNVFILFMVKCESQCNCSEHLCDVTVGCRAYTEGKFLSIIINQDYYRQKFYRKNI